MINNTMLKTPFKKLFNVPRKRSYELRHRVPFRVICKSQTHFSVHTNESLKLAPTVIE